MGDGDLGSVPSTDANGAAKGGGMTVEECQDLIRKSFTNPMVRFLKENLEKSGCTIGSNFISVNIDVCSNNLRSEDEVVQVVIQELIRAYDHCRAANVDWTNCAHIACSEIRINHLSGGCHFQRELLRGYLKIKGHGQECVMRSVMRSLTANPYCSEIAAKDAIEAVWSTCYNDTAPFDRAP